MRITSKGQVTTPQEIWEQCGLLPHTEVHFVVDNGRVWIEKQAQDTSRCSDGLQRLRRARLRGRLSTDALLSSPGARTAPDGVGGFQWDPGYTHRRSSLVGLE